MAGNSGVIRGLHMDHYVVASEDEYVRHQPQEHHHSLQIRSPSLPEMEIAPSDDYTEAMMIDNRRKSCARTTVDDVGYLCGCGGSAVDDAEVVYVKRKTVPQKNAHSSKHMNFSDQREDSSTMRYTGYAIPQSNVRGFREEGFEMNIEDLKYSSPRVGCMPAGAAVVDLLMNGCKPKPHHHLNLVKPKESPVMSKLANEKKEAEHDTQKAKYDDWKKQMLDTVKAPSFNTGETVVEPTTRNDTNGVRVTSSERTYQYSDQLRLSIDHNTSHIAADPPDSKAIASFQSPPHHDTLSVQQIQDTKHSTRSYVENIELNQLRSEQQSLRKAREELESELKAVKRHNRELARTSTDATRADGSVFDSPDYLVNQKFNEIMGIASPKSGIMNINLSSNMASGLHNPSPRLSNPNWSSDAMSSFGLTNLPTSPMRMHGGNMTASLAGSQGFQSYFAPSPTSRGNDHSTPHYNMMNTNGPGALRSPSSIMIGNRDENSHGMFQSDWARGNESHNTPFVRSNDFHTRSRIELDENKQKDEEDLLVEMRRKSAMMEADLMKMKESMSPRFNPMSHMPPNPSPTGNGILRPSSYNSRPNRFGGY